jgi:hypothetical protein
MGSERDKMKTYQEDMQKQVVRKTLTRSTMLGDELRCEARLGQILGIFLVLSSDASKQRLEKFIRYRRRQMFRINESRKCTQ